MKINHRLLTQPLLKESKSITLKLIEPFLFQVRVQINQTVISRLQKGARLKQHVSLSI